MGEYAASAKDYEYFLQSHPTNWAAVNDYAWVLLKAERSQDALAAIEPVIPYWPDNPWLLNTYATALYETREYTEALRAAQKASIAVFKKAVQDNIHSITVALASSTVQSTVKP